MAGSRRIAGMAGAALMAACAADEPGGDVPPPPPTEVREVVDTLHGVDVPDPYRWLEDQEAPETRAWIDAQNAYTDSVLGALPGRGELRTVAASVIERDTIGLPDERGGRYFHTRRRADQDLAVVYVREGLDGEEQVLIDPHPMSPDHTTSVALRDISDDGARVVYGVREGGRRRGRDSRPRRRHRRRPRRRAAAGPLRLRDPDPRRRRALLRAVRQRDAAGDAPRVRDASGGRRAALRRGVRAPPDSFHRRVRRRALDGRPRHRGLVGADLDPRQGPRAGHAVRDRRRRRGLRVVGLVRGRRARHRHQP